MHEGENPKWERASELFGQLAREMLDETSFKFNLVEDSVAGKAAAILVARMREMNGEEHIYKAQKVEDPPALPSIPGRLLQLNRNPK